MEDEPSEMLEEKFLDDSEPIDAKVKKKFWRTIDEKSDKNEKEDTSKETRKKQRRNFKINLL